MHEDKFFLHNLNVFGVRKKVSYKRRSLVEEFADVAFVSYLDFDGEGGVKLFQHITDIRIWRVGDFHSNLAIVVVRKDDVDKFHFVWFNGQAVVSFGIPKLVRFNFVWASGDGNARGHAYCALYGTRGSSVAFVIFIFILIAYGRRVLFADFGLIYFQLSFRK